MASADRYDVLFEPVRIGPVTAKNRFYAVPQCTGMGFAYPNSYIRHREVKAEGGWGVVCTEECMIHPTSDHSSSSHLRLWNDDDIRFLSRVADAVHGHGALLGVELAHAGRAAANRLTREYPLAPSLLPYFGNGPFVARPMDKSDIRLLRKWHRDAAIRAKQAGADIIYVYCAHELSIAMQFLLPRYNQRTDEYGGPLENRVRLLRELLEECKDAVGDTCAVAIRFAVDEMIGPDGLTWDNEGKAVVEMLAELPDLWDVNVSDWANDSGPSRFFEEGYQEKFTGEMKKLTSKPVVGVGRYTSPDRMVSLIKKGHLDFIGAARPSIADPFLPHKIEQRRFDDIRECIGCNVCTTNQFLSVPIRCTQNATIGVEWSRGWHPENYERTGSDKKVLVVGAGPAGLECALTLARRGYQVTVAEAAAELGGRVSRERKLPGLSAWGRIVDYREYQLRQMTEVEIYLESTVDEAQLIEFEFPRVVFAMGSSWRRDGVGRANFSPIVGWNESHVFSADQVMDDVEIAESVVVFDDEHYYMGSAIAEKLAKQGKVVELVTPAAEVGAWSKFTLEWQQIQRRLHDLGVGIRPFQNVIEIGKENVVLAHVISGVVQSIGCESIVMVTSKQPDDELYRTLNTRIDQWSDVGINHVEVIGDCRAPGSIAQAVHDGHRCAFEMDGSSLTRSYKVEPIVWETVR